MKYFLLSCLMLLSACAQLEVITPNPRVEPPETRGEVWKFKVGGTASSSHRYKATEDAGRRPPDLDYADVTGHYDVQPTGYVSVAPIIDLGVEYNLLGNGFSAMAKIQLLGDGSIEAKKGNFPVALFFRGGHVHGDKSGDQSTTFGAGGYNWKGNVDTNYATGGMSAGYRANDWLLIYGGAAFGKYWADVEIKQDPANNGSDAGGTYKKDATGDGFTASGGVKFGWRKFEVYVAVERVWIDYNDAPVADQTSANVGVFFTP